MSLSHVVWCFLSSNLVLLFCQKTVEDFIPIETLFNQNISKQIIKKQTYKKRKETNNKQKCKKQVSRLKKKRTKDKKFSRGVITSDVTHRKALRELQKKLRVEIWEKGLKLEIESNLCLFLLVKKKKKMRLKLMDLSCHFDVLKKDGCSLGRIFFLFFSFFLFFCGLLGYLIEEWKVWGYF